MGLKEIVLGAAIGAAAGGMVAVGGSLAVGYGSAQQKIQHKFGVTAPGLMVLDSDANGDFLLDYGKQLVIAGAVAGAAVSYRRMLKSNY